VRKYGGGRRKTFRRENLLKTYLKNIARHDSEKPLPAVAEQRFFYLPVFRAA